MTYDALLLVSFGGPEGPDDVMPFLENVTRGRGVPKERLVSVAEHYMKFGGVSPINDQNRRLITSLQSELARRDVLLPVYWGNRHWSPFLREAITNIHAAGHRKVLALFTSAYSSYSGCRQYREELAAAVAECGLSDTLVVDKIRPYFDSPGFLQPFIDGIGSALRDLRDTEGIEPKNTRVLFTTHSIPVAMNATSGSPAAKPLPDGTYVAQHKAAATLVMNEVEQGDISAESWSLVFQSRSGPPQVPWLEPDINDAVRTAHADGIRAVVIAPIGFLSDHMEVVWDLDNEALATCKELGLAARRVGTPGTDPRFIESIVDLVIERAGGTPAPALSSLGPWPAPCMAGCCANPREERPHLAGIDS